MVVWRDANNRLSTPPVSQVTEAIHDRSHDLSACFGYDSYIRCDIRGRIGCQAYFTFHHQRYSISESVLFAFYYFFYLVPISDKAVQPRPSTPLPRFCLT